MCNGCDSPVSKAFKAISHGALGIAKAIMGVDPAPKEEVARRRAICRGCEFVIPCKFQPGKVCQCGKCSCILPAKTLVASEQCPIGKWGRWAANTPMNTEETGDGKGSKV